MKSSSAVLIGALVAVAACTEPLSPSQFAGTYQLTGVNSIRLPVTVASQPDGCTTQLSFGRLILADGAFSLDYYSANACPGSPSAAGMNSFGGGLAVQGHTLVLRAIDPSSPTQAVMEAHVTIAGSEADVALPPGALNLANATTLNFYNGPTLQGMTLPSGAPSRSN